MLKVLRAAFLQALLSRRIVSESESKAIFLRVCAACGLEADRDVTSQYEAFIDEIMQHLAPLGLELRSTVDQTRSEGGGVTVRAITNAKVDELSKLATPFTPLELSYIKRVVSGIVTAPDECFCVSTTEALLVARRTTPPLSKRAAEALLDRVVARGWFLQSGTGYYSLGTRAILELQMYLKAEFPDHMLLCKSCDEIVTVGLSCSVPGCDARLHRHCELRSFGPARAGANAANSTRHCPSCNKSWEPLPVGEASIGSGRKPGGQRWGASDDEEEEEQDEIDDEDDERPVSKRGRSAGANKQVAEQSDEDEEADEEEAEDAREVANELEEA
ncbi:Non-SMC (structural maintenance of chromosomes) element 1 protein (NSE1) [Ceraceosorus bombacis]|uniref:Non-structural maintenance of chromosomes element 1 homolog n=1 Tax=Ceraceosorus bombacis TaxID=401625 RepID=A0A0P1BNZ2_9BASI|nr:Non-SMC (structural maintenance of chromosomes) element 1 protein (NSE1) [Ceraceosorus bombacis]